MTRRWFLIEHPIVVALAVIVIFGVLRLLVAVNEVILIGFMAILLSVVLSFPVGWLSHLMSRGLAVIVSLILVCGVVAGAVVLTIPLITTQGKQIVTQIPNALGQLQKWEGETRFAQALKERGSQALSNLLSQTIPAALGVTAVATVVILVLVLAAFLVYRPDVYHDGLESLVPARYEADFDEAWGRMGSKLRHWVGGTLITMVIMGIFTAVGLLIAGIDGWFTLGVLTFFGTFVPYLGAIASSIPGLLMGLAKSPTHLLYAAIVYLGVHIVEGYVIEPFVMRKVVELKPAALLFWVIVMERLFGLVGVIIATPLLVCAKELLSYFYTEKCLKKSRLG